MLKLSILHTFNHPFISAASGIALFNGEFYIVADDELFLGVVNKDNFVGHTIDLFHGVLPPEKKERKKVKPDLESLVVLPSKDLLCIPSGSELHRNRGVIVDLRFKQVTPISFEKLYSQLRETFEELNIEGAVILGSTLRLFQRGNGKLKQNAMIDVELNDLLKGRINILAIKHFDLGYLNNVPLSFTDACMVKNQIYCLLVAENSDSTYLDGEVTGSYIGIMDLAGEMVSTHRLNLKSKPEGIIADNEYFYIVTDDDDRKIAAKLYQGKLF